MNDYVPGALLLFGAAVIIFTSLISGGLPWILLPGGLLAAPFAYMGTDHIWFIRGLHRMRREAQDTPAPTTSNGEA